MLAVDLPSGVSGRHGVVLGAAFRAARTVTFMARKPAICFCRVESYAANWRFFDIGIPQRILERAGARSSKTIPIFGGTRCPLFPRTRTNTGAASPSLQRRRIHTGAARLSAAGRPRVGAGLVTVAAPSDVIRVLAPALSAVMLREIDDTSSLQSWLDTAKLSAFVIGPGFVASAARRRTFVRLLADRSVVVDADGITSFKDDPGELFTLYANGQTRLVLTPHEGEFTRLFPDLAANEDLGKVEKAQAAAKRANAAIVYKGADTVIAAPDGRAFINTNAPPWLATAAPVMSGRHHRRAPGAKRACF